MMAPLPAVKPGHGISRKALTTCTKPTLTVYLPDSGVTPTNVALIVCPGGGFHSLSIMQEGYAVVKWCQKKGITAFLLRYRLRHTLGDDPYKQEIADRTDKSAAATMDSVRIMAVADGRKAIAYVRQHAAEYGISPDKIGIIGFSAGGWIAASAAVDYTPENRPDFAAPIYGPFPPEVKNNVPQDAPPMFIAAAENDTYNLETDAVKLYNAWLDSKHIADLHIYSKGSHGFGMNKQGFESDMWGDNFYGFLTTEGFLKPVNTEPTEAQRNWANFMKVVEERVHNDWPWLNKYKDANAQLPAPAPGEKRVIFMGNSITENWGNTDPEFFKDNGYISRGIGGQTSPQMLVRFREDVINLKPVAVVIEAGTNDIAQNTGPISLEETFGNIVSMAQLAKASGIKPILASVLPASEFSWHKGLQPADKIIALNEMLKNYAAKNHITYIDYWSAMVNDTKGLKVELAQDGLVHPNLAGYKVMEPLAKAAIDKTLK